MPEIDYQKVPLLEQRSTNFPEARDGDWTARVRLNHIGTHGGRGARYKNPPGMVHTFGRLVRGYHYEEHPEYFPLVNGQRTRERAQLCLTHPDVVQIVTDNVRDRLPQSGANIVSVSQNDHAGWCECEACAAIAEREGSQSGPIIHFVNQVADNIKRDYPDVAIDTLAYAYSRHPPKRVKPRPNVIVRLCSFECCFSHPLATCTADTNAGFREDLVGWSRICDRLYVWDYVFNYSHHFLPHPNLHSLQPNIRFFLDHNVKGIFAQGNDQNWPCGGPFAELTAYLVARSLWDPQSDWEEDMEEFLTACYGPAAGPIRRYIDLLHEKVVREDIHIHGWSPPTAPVHTEEIIAASEKLFDEAMALVADDPVRLLRVRKERLPVLYVKIFRQRQFFPTWVEFDAAVQEFADVARRWGFHERLEGELTRWREAVEARKQAGAAGETRLTLHPLSNEWRFATDPDDAGVAQQWFAERFNDRAWAKVRSDRGNGWESQGFPGYAGLGWYRQRFEAPAGWAQQPKVYLYFGAVDEDAYVYLNGKPVFEHSCESTGLAPNVIWARSFAFDTKAHLRFGEPNTLAVRVYSRRGMGGVYLPPFLIATEGELDTTNLSLGPQ